MLPQMASQSPSETFEYTEKPVFLQAFCNDHVEINTLYERKLELVTIEFDHFYVLFWQSYRLEYQKKTPDCLIWFATCY